MQHCSNHPPFEQNKKQQSSSPKWCTCCEKELQMCTRPRRRTPCHKCQKRDIMACCGAPRLSTNQSLNPSSSASSILQPKRRPGLQIRVSSHRSRKITFKLDTGTEVIAVSQKMYQALPYTPPLNTYLKILLGSSMKPLQCVGECNIAFITRRDPTLSSFLLSKA